MKKITTIKKLQLNFRVITVALLITCTIHFSQTGKASTVNRLTSSIVIPQ
jgi:hypothetical protein